MENNPRTLNTDYDKWLKKFQWETLRNLYKRWDAVMAGAEIGNIDLISCIMFCACVSSDTVRPISWSLTFDNLLIIYLSLIQFHIIHRESVP